MTPFGMAGAPAPRDGDPFAFWDGAYVLGALSSSDRLEYEDHLASCPGCRSSVSELSGMPALLALVDSDDVTDSSDGGSTDQDPPLPAGLRELLLGKVSRRRRRWRLISWSVGAAAAAVLVIALVASIRPVQEAPWTGTPDAPALAMTKVAPTAFDAWITVTDHGWGTNIEMKCTYGAWPEEAGHDDDDGGGDKLAMVVVGRDGRHTELATWMAFDGLAAFPSGSTSIPKDKIVAVQVVSADTGDVLLQREL